MTNSLTRFRVEELDASIDTETPMAARSRKDVRGVFPFFIRFSLVRRLVSISRNGP
jgi:hypothetical protein